MLIRWLKNKLKRKPASSGRLDRKSLGTLGETFACRFLRDHNYAIMERNYTCPVGEIDIIARHKDTIVFVEVKSQYTHVDIRPERKVDARKRKKLHALAAYYRKTRLRKDLPCRIDVITVKISPRNKPAEIRHYQRAI